MGPNEPIPPWAAGWKAIITAVFAGVVAVITALALAGGGGDTKTVKEPVPIPSAATTVDGPDRDVKRDDPLPLPEASQDQLVRTQEAEGDIGSDPVAGDLRGRDPTEAGAIEGPLASQEWPGCRTAFVRNFSQLTASRGVIVWHETVSRENGLASQNALTARANNPLTQVSWNFLIGRSHGLCTYTVPITQKAWHASAGNSVGVGIEVEADGTEPSYVTGAGKAKLFAVTRRLGNIYGIPMQHGIVRFNSNCVPTVVKKGIVEHHDLGPCGGGHVDVCSTGLCRSGGPESAEKLPWRIDPLIRELAAGGCNAKCEAIRKQQAVVDSRVRKHAALHVQYGRIRHPACRAPMHEERLRDYRPGECRRLKVKGHSQHLGITRARKKLRSLKA